MPPSAIATYTSQVRHIPYIANQQYKAAQTPVDWMTLVPNGTPMDCEAALTVLIERASTWVDSVCMQVLMATTDTEQKVGFYNRDGYLVLVPRYQPALELTDLWVGGAPNTLGEYGTLQNCWVEPKRILASQAFVPTISSQGPIQFGGATGIPNAPVFCKFTYVNGFPVTKLTAPAAAGSSVVTVANPTGIFAAFSPMRIEDGATREVVSVLSVSGNTVTLTAPLAYDHLVGAPFTALPQDVEEAVVLATSAFSKARGNMGLVSAGTGSSTSQPDPLGAGTDLLMATQILNRGDYIRVAS